MKNGGLYIKIGQGVSAINHMLPKEYTDTLKKLEVYQFTYYMLDIQNICFFKKLESMP